jgi:hypothetical protein
MNLLSGSTWKGAKLRIGEAKPDFRERYKTHPHVGLPDQRSHFLSCRIKRENEAPDNRSSKRRRLASDIQGVHASDMSLVTPENVSSRPGWHVTPMGRIVHPMRMRPEKPLPPMSSITSSSRTTGKKVEKKKRKLEQVKLVRARRRTIDPTKWDSQHLKGVFLDSIIVADDRNDLPVTEPSKPQVQDDQGESDTSSDEEEDEEGDGSGSSEAETATRESQKSPGTTGQPPVARIECDMVDSGLDFNQEKLYALSLLDSMFGGLEGGQEWDGKEIMDSDIDVSGLPPVQLSPSPKSSPSQGPKGPAVEEAREDSESDESSAGASAPALERVPKSGTIQDASTTKAKLKDLFAPQEEQGVLPLISNLSSI